MTILAVDPGEKESGVVRMTDGRITMSAILPNGGVLELLQESHGEDLVCIEMVACYGMAVGAETFNTCLWIGRFVERWNYLNGVTPKLIYRRDIKLHHCGTAKAKDSNIRQALIDKYGPPGNKKAPGGTYGISKHMWAALAVAAYVHETEQEKTLCTSSTPKT